MKLRSLFIAVAVALVSLGAQAQKVKYVPDHAALEAHAPSVAQQAPADDEPIITLKTHRYDSYGEQNIVQFGLLASPRAGQTHIEVDFGYGRRAFTVSSDGILEEDEYEEVIVGGVVITGSVSPSGEIKIYGNPLDIDYFDCHGSEIYEIEMSRMTEMSILELGHNQIRRIDVSNMRYLEYLDIKDNTLEDGLYLGEHPYIKYMNLNQMGDHALDNCNGIIDLTRYKALRIFTAWDAHCLRAIDPTQCEYLQQLSIDNSSVSTLDVTKNQYLLILNISDTPIHEIDLSGNPNLVEFYAANEGQENPSYKFDTIDFSANPLLQRIFLDGNRLTTLDVRKQWNLISLYAANNRISSVRGLDIEKELASDRPVELAYLDLSGNNLTFATLPKVDPMTYFYYDLQHNLPTGKEYGVGEEGRMDLSQWILREGTESYIRVYEISRDGFSYQFELFEEEDFTYDLETGIITFLTAHVDSVQVFVTNTHFTDVKLQTNCCLVRSAANYGKPVEMMQLTVARECDLAMDLTTGADETLYVEVDGERIPFNTQAHKATTITCHANEQVVVYGRVAATIEAVSIEHMPVHDIDLSLLTNLSRLNLVDCGLTELSLIWNHQLRSINVTGNQIEELDLNGENPAFHKNHLTYVNVQDNHMKLFNPGAAAATIQTMNVSHNELSDIQLNEMYYLQSLDLSDNHLSTLNVSYCPSLRDLNVAGNDLKTIDGLNVAPIRKLDIRNCRMRFSNLAALPLSYGTEVLYAPQQQIAISPVSISANFRSEAFVANNTTDFRWIDNATGQPLVPGTDYNLDNGVTTFTASATGRTVYCEMENKSFPALAGDNVLRTNATTIVDQPKYTVAEFTTPVGDQHVSLSLAATQPDTYIYIDWGNGIIEYPLQTTYTIFEAQTVAGARVRIYSNTAANGNMRVFSVDNVTMQDAHLNGMTDLYCLSLNNTGLQEIDLSGYNNLHELILTGNNLPSIDLTALTKLTYVVLNDDHLSQLRLANNNQIGWITLTNNQLTSIDNLPLQNAWNIDVTGNQIQSVDASRISGCQQLFLAQNQIHELDCDEFDNLRVLNISYNRFDISTLPDPDLIPVFYYGGQAKLQVECVDRQIDLSSQVEAWDVPSEIYFFEGEITIVQDEYGNLELLNYEFEEDEEFFNNAGIITFRDSHPAVTGVIFNELYPNLILYTETIPVVGLTEDVQQTINDTQAYKVVRNGQVLVIRDGKAYIMNGQRAE